MGFFLAHEMKSVEMMPGLQLREAHLDQLMITIVDFARDVEVPAHAHPHEQISHVISGTLEFRLAGETRILRAGDSVTIPPGWEHSAKSLEPARVLDAWHPIREDYRI